MTNCEYGNSSFLNCHKDCRYKGRENECPFIAAYYEERNKEND